MPPLFNTMLIAPGTPAIPPKQTKSATLTVGNYASYGPEGDLMAGLKGWNSVSPTCGSINPNPLDVNGYRVRAIVDASGLQTANRGIIDFVGNVPAFWTKVTIGGTVYLSSQFSRTTNGTVTSFGLISGYFNKFNTAGAAVSVVFEY